MQTYEYRAKDSKSGKIVKADVQAENERAAAKLIAKQGLAPIEIKAHDSGISLLGKFRNRVRAKDRVVFARQLSTLISAGLPLTKSLVTVQRQTKSRVFRSIIQDIIGNVESGNTLAKSMERNSQVFSQVFTSLVAAGESSGTLDKALERVANQQEADAEILSKIRGAMVYPAIVLGVIGVVIVFMMKTVLPQVGALYKDLHQELPIATRMLLSTANFISEFWYVVVIALLLLAIGFRRYMSSLDGHKFFDRMKMSLPPINTLFMKLYMARFCRTGASLVSSGVPLLEMLSITARAINNVHIEASLKKAIEKVKGGEKLSASIANDPNFLELVPQMIEIGEESGTLDKMLERTAGYYEKELDNEIKSLSTTIEPILMIVLAIIVGGMVAAVLFPIYSLVGNATFK